MDRQKAATSSFRTSNSCGRELPVGKLLVPFGSFCNQKSVFILKVKDPQNAKQQQSTNTFLQKYVQRYGKIIYISNKVLNYGLLPVEVMPTKPVLKIIGFSCSKAEIGCSLYTSVRMEC